MSTYKINEQVIRKIYNQIAMIYDRHRSHNPNQWSLVEWPCLKKSIKIGIKDKKILDAGCGTGIFIKQIIKLKPKEIVGIDISEKMLEIAKKRCSGSKVKLIRGSIRRIPFKDNYFDLIVALDVLHYIEDIEGVLEEFIRVLKKGEKAIFSIRHPIRNLSYMAKKGRSDYFKHGWYKEKWPGTGGVEVYNFYRPLEEWINSLTKVGFNIKMIIETKPDRKVKLKYPDFYDKYTRIPRGLIFVVQKA